MHRREFLELSPIATVAYLAEVPMSPQVTITHDDGSTDAIPETVGWQWRREIGEMWKLSIDVERSHLDSVTLAPNADEVELAGVATGRLANVERGQSSWTLVVYSFEHDAHREEPLPGGNLRGGTDQELVSGLIDEVGSWTEGSVAELTGHMTFVFNHAFANEGLRRIERNVPGELRWNGDGSVDYVENVGSDKTGSVTLSVSAGNIDGEITITEQGREMDSTHLRVIGANEGAAQRSATLVPDDDPESYDNRVDYSTPRWSPGDVRNWGRWENKDVTDQDAIEEEASALGEELVESLVEAEATVVGEDLTLGDWVHVEKADAGVDRDMRVHRITTKQRGATVVDDVVLSTRTIARDEEANRLRDIQRFNVAFQGSSFGINVAGGRQPVGDPGGLSGSLPYNFDDVDYQMGVYYPDEVAYEHRLTLRVVGLPYRAYSVGGEENGSHDHDVPINITSEDGAGLIENVNPLDRTAILDDGETFTDTFTLPTLPEHDAAFAYIYLSVECTPASNAGGGDIRIRNTTKGVNLQDFEGVDTSLEAGEFRLYQASQAGAVDGDTIEIRFDAGVGTDEEYRFSYGGIVYGEHDHLVAETQTSEFMDNHIHEVFPGVVENFSHLELGQSVFYPANCDVSINGTPLGTSFGDGSSPFQETVDIRGELTQGAFNEITVSSESLGHLQVYLEGDVYRQVLGDG